MRKQLSHKHEPDSHHQCSVMLFIFQCIQKVERPEKYDMYIPAYVYCRIKGTFLAEPSYLQAYKMWCPPPHLLGSAIDLQVMRSSGGAMVIRKAQMAQIL